MADRLVIATIEWKIPRGTVAEAFGPWPAREDGAHLDEIGAFVKRWRQAEAEPEARVKLWAVTSMEEYEQRLKAHP